MQGHEHLEQGICGSNPTVLTTTIHGSLDLENAQDRPRLTVTVGSGGGGGGSLGLTYPPSHIRKIILRSEIYHKDPKLEVDFRYTFFLASDPPPPPGIREILH